MSKSRDDGTNTSSRADADADRLCVDAGLTQAALEKMSSSYG